MQIYNIAKSFLNQYEPSKDYYEKTFSANQEIYNYYFELHCRNKEQKLENALVEHPKKLQQMKQIAQRFEELIPQICATYEQYFPVKFTQDTYIFVGLGGSNAYTYRSMDPRVAFCVEKFETDEDGLKVIVAHEFGHATHHLFTTHKGIDAKAINWSSPYTWLLQEGVATYLSTLIVDAEQDYYFAYTRDIEWITFCEENEARVIAAFQQDLAQKTAPELLKEWFSINGGEAFGYTRLAYYIGYLLVNHLVNEKGIEYAMAFWGYADFEEKMKKLLDTVI